MCKPETMLLIGIILVLIYYLYTSNGKNESFKETCKQRCIRLTDSIYPDTEENKNNRSNARVACMTSCTDTISDQELLNTMKS